MAKSTYKIDHSTNNFKLYNAADVLLYKASWFLEFGKTTSEIYNLENTILYTITKKFSFWKWRMSYTIMPKDQKKIVLNADNKKNTLFKLQLDKDTYEVQIHYFQKKSIYKNGVKIAEINDAFAESIEENTSNIITKDKSDLEIIFLLSICLKTGEINQRPLMKSQKELISITEKWHA